MIPECFFMIENNFNISLKSKERNLRINLLKNSPTALYFLLFMDTIINNPQFNISSNQNGVLMLDSILSFGLFNDIYHYSSEIDFDEIEESFKNFKIFNKDYVLRMFEGCKSLERDEKYER